MNRYEATDPVGDVTPGPNHVPMGVPIELAIVEVMIENPLIDAQVRKMAHNNLETIRTLAGAYGEISRIQRALKGLGHR